MSRNLFTQIMSVLGKNWKYINEGNVHIVIGMEAKDNNDDSNYVLRLIKEDAKPVQWKEVLEATDFVNLIMSPLITNKSSDIQEVVKIPTNELLELMSDLKKFRPKERLIKSRISCFGVKSSNLTILKPGAINYCVEIKLKEGFMSPSFKKYSRCYYCLKQYLKLQEKLISNMSKYCPLDLFSGCKTRMKTALFHLSENPQNNFKLFKNGQIIFSDLNKYNFDDIIKAMAIFKSSEAFFNFIIETLLYIGYRQTISNHSEPFGIITRKNWICDDTTNLHEETILYKILQTQKLSVNLDLSTTNIALDSLEYVPSVLKRLESRESLWDITNRKKFIESAEASHLALIAAIAKDCSIMISFTTYDDNSEYIEVDQYKIPFKVSVTDLEPKLPKTLAKRREMEKKLIEVYEKHLAVKEGCPQSETRAKQLEAWQHLIAEYMKANKQSTIDIRENTPLFNNQSINRKLSQESILTVLEHMAKVGQAAPLDKSKTVWEVYWHSLDEWGNMVYSWACSNGMNNTVCTLFELREGDNTADEEFHGLDMAILVKALKSLEAKGKCELMEFEDSQGVKFF